MTNAAEVPDGAVAPEEKMNAAAASCWQRHHISDLWGAIKPFSRLATWGFKHSLWLRAIFLPQMAAVAYWCSHSGLGPWSPPRLRVHVSSAPASQSATTWKRAPELKGCLICTHHTSLLKRLVPVWSAELKTSAVFISHARSSRLQIEAPTGHRVTLI